MVQDSRVLPQEVAVMLLLALGAWLAHDQALAQSVLAAEKRGQPFQLHGLTWHDHQAFIASGMRCGTTPVGVDEGQAIATGLAQFRAEQPYAAFERDPGSVSVNVYVHVITASNGERNLNDATLLAQIDVLNAAYSGTS